MCQMRPAGTQSVEVEGARVVALAHLQPVAFVRRQAPQEGRRRHAPHAAAARVAASRRGGARPQPCAKLPLPSSWPSILCESP
jgi:hypothetical protein